MRKLLPVYPVFYIAVFLVLIVIILTILIFLNARPDNPTDTPSPTPTSNEAPSLPRTTNARVNPPAIGDLPRQGFAIDTNSPIVQASEQEVEILRNNLPYLRDFTASTGQNVSIVIPGAEYQDDPWKLTAQVFGPDYQIPVDEAGYEREKQTFLEGANDVFSWIERSGADPNAVLIKWGDQAFVQERAETWLDE